MSQHQEQLQTRNLISFAGALNAVSGPSNLGDDEVQSTTNVDFGLTWGAAAARRGSRLYGSFNNTMGTSSKIFAITRNYALSTGTWTDSSIPWILATPDGQQTAGYGSGTATGFDPLDVSGYGTLSNGTPSLIPQFSQYQGVVYLGNNNNAYRIGSNATYPWLIPQADTPVVTLTPQWNVSTPFVGFAGTATGTATLTTGTTTYKTGTYTATEGTLSGTSTTAVLGTATPLILATCTSGTGTRIVLLGGCTITNWENPTPFVTTPFGTAVTSGGGTYTLGGEIDFHTGWPGGDTTGASGPYNGTSTITQTLTLGNFGTDYLLLSLADQSTVVTVQQDLSIGDATFTNYWHQETTASAINDATVDAVGAFIDSNGGDSADTTQQALGNNKSLYPHVGQQTNSPLPTFRRAASKVTISGTPSPWAVNRSDYVFIGALSAPDFTNIVAIRVIVEFTTPGQTAVIGGLITYGGVGYPLNDQASGISYFQTFARVENGFIVSEGAPSLPSTPQLCQFAHAAIAVGTQGQAQASKYGYTHRVIYRNGGLLNDAYRVGSCTLSAAGTSTVYDYALPDMTIINNPVLRRDLWSTWPSPSAGTGLPGVNVISPPWQERLWIGVQNQLYWTYPGQPTAIQDNSQTTVGDLGDVICAIHPGQNLVIVNHNSVYELAGSIFEGTGQNWSLTRTAASRGCAAPRTCIQTPYGILLFGYSGISMYRAGFGQDQELTWVYDKIGDLWKGATASDPAQVKGRIPALNLQAIFNSVATYKDEKLYLAVPTGTSTVANTLFIIDLGHKKLWMYSYPFNICSLFWDRLGNRLMAGTDAGALMQLEMGLVDTTTTGTSTGVSWSYTTRQWSTPVDQLYENLQVDNLGTCTWAVDLDDQSDITLGTTTSTGRGWSPVSLGGSVGGNVDFRFSGTQSGTSQVVYGMQWDSIPLAKKVTFFETDPVAVPSENYVKTWLAELNCGTATVTGSVLVDGTVVMTATFTASNSGGDPWERFVYETGLPNITAGKNISAVYNCPVGFRHHATDWEMEAKPFGKLTWLVTYKKAGGVTQADMARFYAMDLEGTATQTVTNTWIIDGTAFSTNTLTFGATDAGEETGIVRNYMDLIPFPPGARGYLFQQEMTAEVPFRVWRASLDIDRIGIKGLSRVTQNGSPSSGS